MRLFPQTIFAFFRAFFPYSLFKKFYPISRLFRDGVKFLCCNLRDFPDKVINDPDFLHLFPFLRRHNRLMAALNDLPFLTGDNVIGIGADAFLVRPADKMCALIKGISQDMADPCAPPPLKSSNSFNYNFPLTF